MLPASSWVFALSYQALRLRSGMCVQESCTHKVSLACNDREIRFNHASLVLETVYFVPLLALSSAPLCWWFAKVKAKVLENVFRYSPYKCPILALSLEHRLPCSIFQFGLRCSTPGPDSTKTSRVDFSPQRDCIWLTSEPYIQDLDEMLLTGQSISVSN